jgi:hypothetical protein
MNKSAPVIPVGLATRVGAVVGAGFTLVGLVTAVLDGDHSQETITAMILAAVAFVTLMSGRYAQAVIDRIGAAAVEDGEPDFTDDDLAGRSSVSLDDHVDLGDA